MILLILLLTFLFESKRQLRRKPTIMVLCSSYHLVVVSSILTFYVLVFLVTSASSTIRTTTTMGGFIPFASASEIKPQELNRSTFNDLMKSKRNGMVKFYQPWCGHCMRVKPDWDELATVVPSSIFIGDVNCNKEVELCREHHTGVNYPTIMVYRYHDDKEELVEELYTGGLGLDEFRHFVDSILVVERCNVQVAVLELDNNEEAVAKSTSSSTSSSSCTDKEAKYIKKWYPKGYNAWKEEMYRIANMKQRTDMTYDTEKWMNDRMYILDQMIVMKQQQQKEEGDNGSYDDGEL